MGGIVETSASASGGGGFPVTAFRFVVSDAAGNASALPVITAAIPFYSVNTGRPAVNANLTYHDDANQLVVGGASPQVSLQGTSGITELSIFDLGNTEALLALSCNSTSATLALDPSGNTNLTSSNNTLNLTTAGFDVKLGDNNVTKYLTLKATTGNVLINKTADNGVDQLQVTGTIFSFNSVAPVGLHMSVGGVLANVIEDAAGNLNLSNSANANGIVLSVGGRALVNTLTDDGSNTLQVNGSLKATSLTIPGLTAARVPFAGSGGTLTDSPNLTFVSGTGLTLAGNTPLAVNTGSIAASAPAFNITQAWNNAAVAFTGIKANFTVTASNNAGLFLDLQRTGNSTFQVTEFGESKQNQVTIGNNTFSQTFGQLGQNAWTMNSGIELAWSNSTTGIGTKTSGLAQNAAGVIEINSGVAGTLRDITMRDLFTNDATFLIRTKTTLTNNAAAQIATLTNGPTAGNPTKWVAVDDNGTTRFFPLW